MTSGYQTVSKLRRGPEMATQIDVKNRLPSTMVAYYARDYRDALIRLARFKQLCTPEQLQIKRGKDECPIEPVWLHARGNAGPVDRRCLCIFR